MKQMGLDSVSSWWHNHTEGNMASDFKRLASLQGIFSLQPSQHHEILSIVRRNQHQTNRDVAAPSRAAFKGTGQVWVIRLCAKSLGQLRSQHRHRLGDQVLIE